MCVYRWPRSQTLIILKIKIRSLRSSDLQYQIKIKNVTKLSFRLNNANSLESLDIALQNFNWEQIKSSDINVCAKKFLKTINDLYSKKFPLKMMYVASRSRYFKNTLITPVLRNLIKIKSDFFLSSDKVL